MSDDRRDIAPAAQDTKKLSVQDWLQTEVTLTLPRWMLVAGGGAVLILLLIALD